MLSFWRKQNQHQNKKIHKQRVPLSKEHAINALPWVNQLQMYFFLCD